MESEIEIWVNSAIDTFIGLTVLLMMLSLGLGSTFRDISSIWTQPSRLIRSILSAVVAALIVTYITITIFDDVLPPDAQVALLLLAAAAGSPMVPKLGEKVGADPITGTSTLVTLSAMAIITSPLVIALPAMPDEVDVTAGEIALLVLRGVLLPVLVGVAIRRWWKPLANLITEPLKNISDKLVMIVVGVIIVKDFDTMLDLGFRSITIFAGLATVLLVIGHVLGGRERSDRVMTALFTANRNDGIALLVATSAFPAAFPAMVAYGVVALIAIVIYMSIVSRAELADASTPPSETSSPTPDSSDRQ
jgi:BASS family bile acid:Na+ symporter